MISYNYDLKPHVKLKTALRESRFMKHRSGVSTKIVSEHETTANLIWKMDRFVLASADPSESASHRPATDVDQQGIIAKRRLPLANERMLSRAVSKPHEDCSDNDGEEDWSRRLARVLVELVPLRSFGELLE